MSANLKIKIIIISEIGDTIANSYVYWYICSFVLLFCRFVSSCFQRRNEERLQSADTDTEKGYFYSFWTIIDLNNISDLRKFKLFIHCRLAILKYSCIGRPATNMWYLSVHHSETIGITSYEYLSSITALRWLSAVILPINMECSWCGITLYVIVISALNTCNLCCAVVNMLEGQS